MPTYQYRCTSCDVSFDYFQSFSEDRLSKCPNESEVVDGCSSPGKGAVERLFSAPAIIFKGKGFYKTDSGVGKKEPSSGSEKKDDSSQDTSKKDTGSVAKKDTESKKSKDTKGSKESKKSTVSKKD